MEYVTKSSKTVFHGRVFNVRTDEVQRSSEQTMHVDVVEHGGAVVIAPIDHENRVWFVDQYRYPADRRLLELPAGTLEHGEEPEICTIRECREEIGMYPGKITHLGGFFLAPGYSTEYIHLYLAQELSPSPLEQDEDEDIQLLKLNFEQIKQHLENGLFSDSKTVASLFVTFQYLGILTWN
jgi:ADP-ribose pyrophosphatase